MQSEAEAAEGETASIRVLVTPKVWKRLHDRKGHGVSFSEVISELLDDADEALAEDTR